MSTTTLRPNGSINSAGTLTGAASRHAALSDDSDSSYVTLQDYTTEALELDLGTFTLGDDIVKAVSCTVRAGDPTDGLVPCNVQLVEPSAVAAYMTVNLVGAGIADHSSGTIALPAVTAMSAADQQSLIDDWYALIQITKSSTSAKLYELDVVVTHVDQPSVTATAVSPDPYTASTLVPISWANTLDSDGGGQTHYQIRVFDETTYGSGFSGLDEDNDTPYYDSGVVAGSATTANVGPLENGDTYRVAVKVAQTVNGVKFWSDWDTDDFDISVTTAEVDTVTPVATDASGLITVTVARDTGEAAWEYLEVQRSVDNKATWQYVRGAEVVAKSNDNSFVVVDYGAPNGTSVYYRARATRTTASKPVTGSWVESSAEDWTSTDCWLKNPLDSDDNITFDPGGLVPHSFQRSRRVGVFQVVGAAAPVTVSDVRSTRSGTLHVHTSNASEAADLEQILDNAAIILVQFPASADIDDMYVAPTGDTSVFMVPSLGYLARRWEIDYVEVDAPADADAGSL